jgi:hypothetical protein
MREREREREREIERRWCRLLIYSMRKQEGSLTTK